MFTLDQYRAAIADPIPTVTKFGVRVFVGDEVVSETGGIYATLDEALDAATEPGSFAYAKAVPS